jgi:hypothetical protein
MRKKVNIRHVMAVGLLAVVLAGACGDDDEEDENAAEVPPPAADTLTKEEFVRQADAVCVETRQQLAAVRPPNQGDAQDRGRYFDDLANLARTRGERLRALRPPPADQATVDQLHRHYDQQVAKFNEYGTAEKAGNRAASRRAQREGQALDRQFDQVAQQYGLVECAKDA